jgi:hypothetical protein
MHVYLNCSLCGEIVPVQSNLVIAFAKRHRCRYASYSIKLE